MLSRKILNELMLWKEKEKHKSLIIYGARQVGKTFAVREFGKSYDKAEYALVFPVGSGYYDVTFSTYNGNRPFGADGLSTDTTYLTTEDGLKGIEQLTALKADMNSAAADLSTSTVKSLFTNGDAAMFISGLWDTQAFKEAGLNVGATTLPSLLDETTPSTSFNGTRAMFVSAYSKLSSDASVMISSLASMTNFLICVYLPVTMIITLLSV